MGDPYYVNNPCTKRIRAFKNELKSCGYDVFILAPNEKSINKVEGVIYCQTVALKKKTTIYRLLNSLIFAFTSFFKSFGIGHVDVVITTCPPPLINISGWFIAKCKHAKLIYDVRDIWPDIALEMGSFSEKSIYYKTFKFIRDFMLKNSDMILAVSPSKVVKLKKYTSNKKIINIPNGFDMKFLENKLNNNILEEYSSNQSFKCVYIGNLGLAQGLHQLLFVAEEAQKSKMNVTFWIYGSGVEEEELKKYAVEHNLKNVFFKGKIPNSDIYTVLNVADVSFVSIVNGNLKDMIPTKMYEALGVGCPVLLAARGDAVDVLEETGFGIAVKPNDNLELWKAFCFLYKNKNQIMKNADNAKYLMQNKYSRQLASEKLVTEIAKLCE